MVECSNNFASKLDHESMVEYRGRAIPVFQRPVLEFYRPQRVRWSHQKEKNPKEQKSERSTRIGGLTYV